MAESSKPAPAPEKYKPAGKPSVVRRDVPTGDEQMKAKQAKIRAEKERAARPAAK